MCERQKKKTQDDTDRVDNDNRNDRCRPMVQTAYEQNILQGSAAYHWSVVILEGEKKTH